MSIEDIAQEAEIKQWERINVGRPTQQIYAPLDTGYGPEECQNEECGDDMPVLRRELGRTLCTACQQRAEDTKKQRG